jgi:fructose-1,6-bisphosphatase I
MEIEPKELHERTPLFIGSNELVDKLEEFIATEQTVDAESNEA